MPELFDTHCHLDMEPLLGQVEAVLERARAAGVQQCVTIGTSVEASRANLELARRFSMLKVAVGVHPHEADGVTDETLAAIDALAGDPRVVAIGEVGLDYHYKHSTPDHQQRALRGFLELARRHDLPLLFHCRNAYKELLDTLKEMNGTLRGLIHCASGPPEFIQGALALGLHVSFSGTVTFPKAQATQALVALVPDDRLLLETDAPFLAPQPVRGRPNEPAYVAHTAAFLAQWRGTTLDALGALTSRNARMLFKR